MRNMRGMWLCMPPLVGGIEQGGKPQEKIKNIGKFGESSFVFFRAYLLRVQWFCSRPRPPLLLLWIFDINLLLVIAREILTVILKLSFSNECQSSNRDEMNIVATNKVASKVALCRNEVLMFCFRTKNHQSSIYRVRQ